MKKTMSRDDLNFCLYCLWARTRLFHTFSILLKGGLYQKLDIIGGVFRHLETPPSWLGCASNMPGWQRGGLCPLRKTKQPKRPKKNRRLVKVMFLNSFVFSFRISAEIRLYRSLGFAGVEPYFLEYKVYIYAFTRYTGTTNIPFRWPQNPYNILPRVARISFSPTHVMSTFNTSLGDHLLHHQPHSIIRIQAPRH